MVNRKLWIDLDNTPHIPFFRPIIRELTNRGYETLLTARDAFQVCDLANKMGLKPNTIGKHYGKHRLAKVFGLIYRSIQLSPYVMRNRPCLAISHGSRSQLLLCKFLRVPTILIFDYEFAKVLRILRPSWFIAPDAILLDTISPFNGKLLHYPGLKENVYVPTFQPEMSLPHELGLKNGNIVVTVRPPATEAHYHNPFSETLFDSFMAMLSGMPNVQAVLLPRNKQQQLILCHEHPEWFHDRKVIVPDRAIDGLNLIWHSDLVVSGGGTMNREAAAMGVPVYSIFCGRTGAIDRYLSDTGKLVLIETVADLHSKIVIKPRNKDTRAFDKSNTTLEIIVDHIDNIYRFYNDKGHENDSITHSDPTRIGATHAQFKLHHRRNPLSIWLHLFYLIKPLMPRSLQLALRRLRCRAIMQSQRKAWPIDEVAASMSDVQPSWPFGKSFAFVLTHDVETSLGVKNVLALMQLEKELGFRSSFNFVARDYPLPEDIRLSLIENGFEVGVHGLSHNHKMYYSEKAFKKHSLEINKQLKAWGSVGFRSPAMLHNLDWFHYLNIRYDASTFDTDPFEPQPHGTGKILPFIVRSQNNHGGYVELPYTLPQDCTLFTMLKETSPDIWKRKLDWIANKKAMALLIVHPDYLCFSNGCRNAEQYPAQYFLDFLEYLRHTYSGQYWNPLPREMADFWIANHDPTRFKSHDQRLS